jgi:hypothetical protein
MTYITLQFYTYIKKKNIKIRPCELKKKEEEKPNI